MSYIKPSVLVYQDLQNSGGVLNATPDLECCIIGPAYNFLQYVPGSIASMISTAALSSTSTTGSMTAGSANLTVASTGGFSIGDNVLVVGAGPSGTTLAAVILNIVGNVITLDTAATLAVTGATVTKKGSITNASVNNTYTLPGIQPGQVVDATSIAVWLDNVMVSTLVTGGEAYTGSLASNVVYFPSLSTTPTAGVTSGATSLTVASANGLTVGDSFTLAGAGVAGATFTGKITGLVGTNVTFTPATSTTVTAAAAFTKVLPTNLNSSTNTLRVEDGDQVNVSYIDNTGVSGNFTTSVKNVNTTSGLNGTLTSLELVDSLPSNLCKSTTGTTTSGNMTITSVVSTSGISTGSKVLVKGAGANGTDFLGVVASFVANTSITLTSAPLTSVSGTSIIIYNSTMTVTVHKTYQDQVLPAVKPISGGANYSTANAGSLGQLTINSGSELPYGPVYNGDVYIQYRALRTDLSSTVLAINDINDLIGQLGAPSDSNPLALGCQIALANTVTRVRAIAIGSNDLAGYQAAFQIAEGERLYYLVPLTQDLSVISALKAHVVQMSTPENAAWRVGIVNTLAPTMMNVGQYSSTLPNTNSGNNAVALVNGSYVLTSSNATFISDGVVPGDLVNYGGAVYSVTSVISNQQLVLNATTSASSVSYYISRAMTKTQKAAAIASTSANLASNRCWHVQPDTVGVTVNGVVKYLPGYYLACGLAGMGAGFPVQQGFTNIGVAGISDLKNSNFYYSKADINTMAGSGTCLFVQDTQGSIPYCRHELTTDVTVLEYREMLVVKNWDFLSYFYYDKLKGFIGSWNITPDTINTIRQVLTASSELIKGQKLPRIGAPLLGYSIQSLEQNAYNKDNLDVVLSISVVYPLNYLNLHLVI